MITIHIVNTNKYNLKWPQMTSKDLKWPQIKILKSNPLKKNKLRGGASIEITEKYLDEIFHNNYLKTDLAVQKSANDKTVRSDTLHDLKEFNFQFLATQAKKDEQIVGMMTAIKNTFNL